MGIKKIRKTQSRKTKRSKPAVVSAPVSFLHPELKVQLKPQSLDHEMLPRVMDSAIMVVKPQVAEAKRGWKSFLGIKPKAKKSPIRAATFTLAVAGIVLGSVTMFAPVTSLFSDTEASGGSYETGILNFSLDKNNWQPDKKLKPGESTARKIEIEQEGSLDFVYRPSVAVTGGKQSFCNALVLTAKLGGVQLYQGPLPNLDIPAPQSSESLPAEWEFIVMLPGQLDNFDEDKCKFNFVYTAWQEELTNSTGFTDTEFIENEIQSDKKKKSNNNNHQGANLPEFLPLDFSAIDAALARQQELLEQQQQIVEEAVENIEEITEF